VIGLFWAWLTFVSRPIFRYRNRLASRRLPGWHPFGWCGLSPPHEHGLDRPAVTEPANYRIEDRRQEDAEQRHPDHAGEDGRSEGAPHLGPGPLRDHQRQHAEDEREGRHDD